MDNSLPQKRIIQSSSKIGSYSKAEAPLGQRSANSVQNRGFRGTSIKWVERQTGRPSCPNKTFAWTHNIKSTSMGWGADEIKPAYCNPAQELAESNGPEHPEKLLCTLPLDLPLEFVSAVFQNTIVVPKEPQFSYLHTKPSNVLCLVNHKLP